MSIEFELLRKSYHLKPMQADPRRFLLDPHNPRIALLLDDPSVLRPEADVQLDRVQKIVARVLQRPEFALSQLIASIRQRGFVNDGSQMLVKRVGSEYLVLEGNRRTAAMHRLLEEPSLLTPSVRESIRTVEVQEFTYVACEGGPSERDVIEMLLGQIHISGKLSWGALERADYIYHSYCRLAKIRAREMEDFYYDVSIAARVGELFNCSTKDVRTSIMIARNYFVLQEMGLPIQPDHFSLLQLATTTRAVKEEIFGLSETKFHFSKEGAWRFADTCIEEDRFIHNPRDFRIFKDVVDSGDANFIKRVMTRELSLARAEERLDAVTQRDQFKLQLERANEILKEIPVAAFRETEEEKRLIRIAEKLVGRLGKLVED